VTLAFLALLLQVGTPRWTAVEGIRVGGSVDDILSKGGECRPGDAVASPVQPGPFYRPSAVMFAQTAFGYALPHAHPLSDSTAIRRALGAGSMCWASLGRDAHAMAAAVDRRVVALIVYFVNDSGAPLPVDSARRRAYAMWGRPTHHSPTLDTWSSPRYRSYFMVPFPGRPDVPGWAKPPQLILLDIAACSAFDRRVHRAGASGEVGEC